MKKKLAILFGINFVLCGVGYTQANTWSVKFSDAIISRYQPTINTMTNKGWEYSNGIILHGMEKIYNETNDPAYLNYIKAYIDAYVDANGNVTGLGKTVDKIQPGVLCLFLYEKTGQLKYKTAATNIKNYMFNSANFYRTPDGGFWHKSEQTTTSYTYYHVMMVDGMYMLHPFLAKYAAMFNEPALFDEVTFQLLFLGEKSMPNPAPLPRHAWEYYDYKTWSDATTHQSTDVWSRGTGWYMMALADVLQYLPTTHPKYADVLALFQRMSAGVAARQEPNSGLWYQVVDKPTASGNWLESSGSGMFVYALKKGVDNGWLNSATYLPVCNKGWSGMQTRIGTFTDGKPQIQGFCQATGVVNNTAAYTSMVPQNCPATSGTQHPHGYCGILMAASEMEFPIVTIPVSGVSLNQSAINISVGGTQQLTATVAPANATNKNVSWASSNTAVATVSATGLVTAVSAGNATITVTTLDGSFTASADVVSAAVGVTGVSLTPASLSLPAGNSQQLTAQVLPANATNKQVSWSSDNTGVATVNATGLVTAVSPGTANLTVTTTDGGFTASAGITVTAPVQCTWTQYQAESGTRSNGTIDVNYTGYTGTGFVNTTNANGSWIQLTLNVPVAGNYDMRFRYANGNSSNRNVSVNTNGVVVISTLSLPATGSWSTWVEVPFTVALNAGNNTIRFTALSSGGVPNTDRLDVCQPPVSVTSVSVSPASLSLGQGGSSTITATVLPSNATNKTVNWSSSNTAVATVNTSGVVTGVAAGAATITATTVNGGFTSSSNVTVLLSCTAVGNITLQRWNSITGTTVASLTGNANYPNSPSTTSTLTLMEIPTNAADNYGVRVSGTICAPATGAYTFWIAGDDNSELWLSTNSGEAGKARIAYHTGYTNSREWNKFTTQKSAVINLVQGNKYYVEAIMKEGTGGDNLAVGWLKPGQTGTVPSEVIPGSVLSPRTGPVMLTSVRVISPDFAADNAQTEMKVYPNPSKGKISVMVPGDMVNQPGTIRIINFSGQSVLEQKRILNRVETMDLDKIGNGSYLVSIRTDRGVVSKQFILIR